MTFTENIDQEKLAEAALAILSLTAVKEMGTARAWKGMDYVSPASWLHRTLLRNAA